MLYQSTGTSHTNIGFMEFTRGMLISSLLVKKEPLRSQPFQYIIILICLHGGRHFVTEIVLAVSYNIISPETFWGTLNIGSIATRKTHKLLLRYTWTQK